MPPNYFASQRESAQKVFDSLISNVFTCPFWKKARGKERELRL